jgi:hypothetical protein
MNRHVLKRPTNNATASVACRLESITIVLDLFALAAHARVAAIENRARLWAVCPAAPVPVWLCAIVATLDSQRVLIRIREVPMPG